VRQALTWAFDFETMNRTLFYGLYTRTDSYFEGGELASSACRRARNWRSSSRSGTSCRRNCSREFKLPVYDTPQATRDNLRKAFDLFKQAGWTSRDGKLVNAKGEQFTIEFLGDDPSDERIIGPTSKPAQARHRRHAAHRRHQPVCEPRAQFRFRHA
jgi:microcin C transport system substrate-binding protein